jgi:hypothetical protein
MHIIRKHANTTMKGELLWIRGRLLRKLMKLKRSRVRLQARANLKKHRYEGMPGQPVPRRLRLGRVERVDRLLHDLRHWPANKVARKGRHPGMSNPFTLFVANQLKITICFSFLICVLALCLYLYVCPWRCSLC